jgi:polysaccharide deacetylase 2 family uncharacterized protein YibQ
MRFNGGFIPWLILFSIFGAIIIVVLFTLLFSPAGESEFSSKRAVLNDSLREALVNMGIKPEDRAVQETHDRAGNDTFSWTVLNWRIRIRHDFDLKYARRRLEAIIRDSGGSHDTTWNIMDDAIPLKIEAFIGDRLSHRIFFTFEPTELGGSPVFRTSAYSSLEQRWKFLNENRLKLDKDLQKELSDAQLNGPPLLITEYWEENAGGRIINWVISVNDPARLDGVIQRLNSRSPDAIVMENHEMNANGIHSVLDISIEGPLSHRVYFTNYPDARGINPAKWNSHDAVYLIPPRAAIIIDDIGYVPATADSLMNLGIPVTLSILPNRPYSTEIALRAKQRNFEVMMHLPMEPISYPDTDPGRGKILVGQNKNTQQQRVEENISSIPYVRGVNNHMGSRAMTDVQTVQNVLEVIKKRGLFFIDSRTTADTIGYTIAENMNIPAGQRSVFLDSTDKADIQYSIEKLREVILRSKLQGSCIAVGHPSRETIEAIRRMIDEFRAEGIVLVFASELVS